MWRNTVSYWRDTVSYLGDTVSRILGDTSRRIQPSTQYTREDTKGSAYIVVDGLQCSVVKGKQLGNRVGRMGIGGKSKSLTRMRTRRPSVSRICDARAFDPLWKGCTWEVAAAGGAPLRLTPAICHTRNHLLIILVLYVNVLTHVREET